MTSPLGQHQNGAAILWDVAEEHLDEAEFLFETWLAAARSPRVTLAQLQGGVERRLLAHLDGLAVGGTAVARRVLWPAMAADGDAPVCRVAAAALASLADPDSANRDRLIALLGSTERAEVRAGLVRAFQVTARADVDEPLRLALYATDAAATQAALLAILSARRVDPGPILSTLLRRPDPEVTVAALRAAAAAERAQHRDVVEALLAHADPAIRGAALRTGLIWNLASAWRSCLAGAKAGWPEAALYVGLLGGRDELPVLIRAPGAGAPRQQALFALGFSGRRDAVEACLPLLDDPEPHIGPLAMEAVAAITGLPLFDPPFAAPAATSDEEGDPPPLEDDLRVDLAPGPHDQLAAPVASQVRTWWAQRAASLAPDGRYLGGEPLSPASLQSALEAGPLRRSGPLALEVAIRSGGRVQLPALRLAYSMPALPPEAALGRRPAWT